MRITGRQLRQIIKEEVSRMMNEADPTAGMNMNSAMGALMDLEDALNSTLGTNFGSTGSKFAGAINGSDRQAATLIKRDLADAPQDQYGGEYYRKYSATIAGLVFQLHGKPRPVIKVRFSDGALEIGGKIVGDGDLDNKLNAAGAFFASQLGVA